MNKINARPVMSVKTMTAVLAADPDGVAILGAWNVMEMMAREDPEGCVRLHPGVPMGIPALAEFFHCAVGIVEKAVDIFGKLNRLTVKDGLIRICSCVAGTDEDAARGDVVRVDAMRADADAAQTDADGLREHRKLLNRLRVRRFREKKKRERMMAACGADAAVMCETVAAAVSPEGCRNGNGAVMDVMADEEKRKKQRKENLNNNNNNKYANKLISIYEPEEKMETGIETQEENGSIISSDKLPISCRNILEAWNKLPLKKFTGLVPSFLQKLNDLLSRYGEAAVRKAVESIGNSPFLLGKKGKSFSVTLGWLLKPDNFAKVLSGKYKDRNDAGNSYMDRQPGERFPFYLPGEREGDAPMTQEETETALYKLMHPRNALLEESARLLGLPY